MVAEITGITERNDDSLSVILGEIAALHDEIHEALRLLRKHDALLEQFRPLLDRYSTPAGAYMAARQARKRALQEDGNGQVPQP